MQKKVTAQKNKYKGEPCWGKWQGALGPTTGCILQDPWMGSIHTNTFSWHSVYYLTICRENSLQSLCLSSPSATEKCATRTALNQELRKTMKHTLLLTPLLPRMIFIFSVGAFRHLAVLSWAGIICEGKERKDVKKVSSSTTGWQQEFAFPAGDTTQLKQTQYTVGIHILAPTSWPV